MRTMQVTGHIVADAELKLSKNGKQYLSFRIGNNEYNDKDANGNQRAYWINITSYNSRFFGMSQYLTKGKPVIIVGDYNDRVYQNREGNCEVGREILANAIYFNSVNGDGSNNNVNTNRTTVAPQASPVTQTKMTEVSKPTTAELKVPKAKPTSLVDDSDDDDLPF